jgi:hypothetical protein
MPNKRIALLAAVIATLAAAPTAFGEVYVPELTPSSYWLHAGSTPLGNVDANQGTFVKWDTTKPTGAAGALYSGNNYTTLAGATHDPAQFLTLEGKVKGDIDNLAFDLFFVGPSQMTLGCPVSLSVELKVDGETVISQDYTGSDGFNDSPADQQTRETRFVLTNIFNTLQSLKVAHGPNVVHDVYANFQNFYACNEFVWRYDSAAYPAGFIANMPNVDESGYFVFDVEDPPPSSAG